MKKSLNLLSVLMIAAAVSACGNTPEPAESSDVRNETVTEETQKEAEVTEAVSEQQESEPAEQKILTDDQAVAAITKYCYSQNPDLESIVNGGGYEVYWKVESSSEDQIVVLYRSYTAAEVRYYIDPVSGDTYVTEFVLGITPEESKTEETLNVWDYVD